MENITHNKTDETPLISFNTNGTLIIEGVSIPENVLKFYGPVMDWLNEFSKSLPTSISLTLQIEYMNTSSTRILVDILRKVKSFQTDKNEVKFIWAHDDGDDEAVELGEELEFSTGIKFMFKPILL